MYEDSLEEQDPSISKQLDREYPKQQFVQIMQQLLKSLKIVGKDDININNVYEDILTKSGRVVGKHIVQSVQNIQQEVQSRKIIKKEVKFFRDNIQKLLGKNISCVSHLQYQQIFNNQGIIYQQLQQQIKNCQYISLAKLSKLIDQIQYLNQNNQQISNKVQMTNLQQQSIIFQDQYNQAQLENIKIPYIGDYIQQKVQEEKVKRNLLAMFKYVQKKMNSLEQSQLMQKQIEEVLRSNLDRLDNELYNNQKIIQSKQVEIQRVIKRINQLEVENFQINKRYQEDAIEKFQVLEEQNEELRKYLAELTVKNQQSESKLNWFKQNYNEVTKEYQKFLLQKQEQELKQKLEKQQRLFTQRTIKQQLQDAQGKITRLRIQNGELKNKASQLVVSYQTKIKQLQNYIKQLQDAKLQYRLTRRFDQSKIRNSYLDARSRIGNQGPSYYGSHNGEVANTICSQDSQENPNRSSVVVFQSLLKQRPIDAFKKKKQLISIRACSIISAHDQQDHKYLQQHHTFPKTKQKANKKQKNEQNQKSQSQIVSTQKKRMKIMCNLAYLINSQGNKFPIYVIVSEDRFSFLDSKLRPTFSIKFNQMRKIIFCYYNPNWIVLKAKANQFNDKNQLIYDKLLSIQNREDILQYLQKKSSNILFQSCTKLTFQKQDSIWFHTPDSEILLSNFASFDNIKRMSISNIGHMFEANVVKSTSLFNSGVDAIVMVTGVGILVFERDGDNLLDREQKLLFIIPIIELMEIQTNLDSPTIIVRYSILDKKLFYKIKMYSLTLCKKLRDIIQAHKKSVSHKKQLQINRYSVLTSVLNKSILQKDKIQ